MGNSSHPSIEQERRKPRIPHIFWDRFFLACGPVGIIFFCLFLPCTKSLPLISPSLTGEDLTYRYKAHDTAWKATIPFMELSAILWPMYAIGVNKQLARIPGISPSILSTQVASANCIGMAFMTVAVYFAVTTFRLDRDPELTQILSDTAWLYLTIIAPVFIVQDISISLGIRSDTRTKTLIPKWVSWVNTISPFLYFGVLGSHCVHGGAVGWAGALTWWLTAGSFFVCFLIDLAFFWIAAGIRDEDLE